MMFDDLPDEVLERILLAAGVSHAKAVCRRWRRVLARYRVQTSLALIVSSVDLADHYCFAAAGSHAVALRRRICDAAVAAGATAVLEWAHARGCPLSQRACDLAAAGGRVDTLRWLREKGAHWGESTTAAAAAAGELETLRWLRDEECPWDGSACAAAAEYGSIEILAWLRDRGCPWDERTCSGALHGGHVELLRWALHGDCPCDVSTVCEDAAYGGNLEMLRGFRHAGVLSAEVWVAAIVGTAGTDRLVPMLEWLRAEGCPWGDDTCEAAVVARDFGALRWLRARGCPWGRGVCERAAHRSREDPEAFEMLRWAVENGCEYVDLAVTAAAARGGSLEVLLWLRARGCPWDESACAAAAAGGHLDVLRWLRGEGCPWGPSAYAEAARIGDLEVLCWLRAEGCEWDARACVGAALGGHADALRWLLTGGAPYDGWLCAAAARGGHTNLLACLRRADIPWDYQTCMAAIAGGHLETLKWIVENTNDPNVLALDQARPFVDESEFLGELGVRITWATNASCPWDEKTCPAVDISDRRRIALWVRLIGGRGRGNDEPIRVTYSL